MNVLLKRVANLPELSARSLFTMKIACPKCNASGSLPEHEIPESGRFISCPRCHEGFTVTRPRSGTDGYLVDTCPACGFSTFGDEPFGSCPKCGVVVKTFVDRQREEQLLKHNQELLGKKMNNSEVTSPPPDAAATSAADFIAGLQPVHLIGWGVAAIALVFIGMGLWGIFAYDSAALRIRLMEETDESVSGWYLFFRFGAIHWLTLLYGGAAMAVALLFMKRMKTGLRAMNLLLWTTVLLVPLIYIVKFIQWAMAPIPHTISGYLIEILNILCMSALTGVPLLLVIRLLRERNISSVFKF